MKASDLLCLFRSDVTDPEMPGDGNDEDSLWSDDEIYDYMEATVRKFAKITEMFLDSSTTEITTITVTADDPWVDIDPRVIKIRRAKLTSNLRPLKIAKAEDLDSGYLEEDYGLIFRSGWEDATGTPKCMIMNMEKDKARLVNIPTTSDTITLSVVRYQLDPITGSTGEIETDDIDHKFILLDGMKSYAYAKQDADTFDPDMEAKFKAKFQQGAAEVAREIKRLRKPAGVVKYGGL